MCMAKLEPGHERKPSTLRPALTEKMPLLKPTDEISHR
jgi:hypothetical protein